jgi:predicted acetyltransferase
VKARNRPLDDPLRWLLADPRQLRTTGVSDFLWVRLIDVPAALGSRGYGTETELVLEVTGPVTQRYQLSTGPVSGHCRRAHDGEKADLVLSLRELGAIYLGGCRPSVLAAAGQIQEVRAGALARADAAFASPLAPFCGTFF